MCGCIRMHVRSSVNVYTCVRRCWCDCVLWSYHKMLHVCTYIYVCMDVYICVCMYICMHVCMYVCMYVCVREPARVRARVHVRMCGWVYMYVYA